MTLKTKGAIPKPQAVSYEQRVATEYQDWLAKHPKVGKKKRVNMFDEIADAIRGQ